MTAREEEGGGGGLPPPFPAMKRCVKMEEDPISIYPSMEEFLSQRLASLSTSLYPPLQPMGSLTEVNESEQGYSIFILTTEEIFYRFNKQLIVFNEGGEAEEDDEEEDKREEEDPGLDGAYVAEEVGEVYYSRECQGDFVFAKQCGYKIVYEGEFIKEEGYKEEYYEYNSSTCEEYHGYHNDNNGDDCYDEDCGCWCFLDHYKYKPGDDICTFLQPCPFLQPY